MGITVGDNFDHKSKKPLDGRVQYATLAAMKAVSDANIYEGCTAFCVETGKEYRFLSSNTVNEDTGKWREHEGQTYTGGDNVEISNENVISATDTTYSAGDGIVIDSENNNEISADIMPSSDMEEVAYPLPGVRKQGIVYSTKEQVVGEWIDGKPLYQKTVECTLPTVTSVDSPQSSWTAINANVDVAMLVNAIMLIYDSGQLTYMHFLPSGIASVDIAVATNRRSQNPNTIRLYSKAIVWSGFKCYVTIQYTKTTS